jgi:hypothetical protein
MSRGDRLVRVGLGLTVLGAAGLLAIALVARVPVDWKGYGRLLVIALLAYLTGRGTKWARWLLGLFAVLGGGLAGVIGAVNAWPNAVASFAFLIFGFCFLGGFLLATRPKAARDILTARAAAATELSTKPASGDA